MKRKIMNLVLVLILCVAATQSSAFAEEPVASETPENGNLTVVEQGSNGTQEFYQVQSKNGNTFYIIVDRTKNTENVYFLNQVDEADLMALIGEKDIQPAKDSCICDTKCSVGHINTECPVCSVNMTECFGEEGKEPAATQSPTAAQTQAPATSTQSNDVQIPQQVIYAIPVVVILVVVLVIGLIVRKKKSTRPAPAETEEYDPYEMEDDFLEEGDDEEFDTVTPDMAGDDDVEKGEEETEEDDTYLI